MELVKRSTFGWGPTAAGLATPRNGLVIHYDGSNQGLAGKPHAACLTYWRRTRQFHMGAARGWADIGYSFGCCPHGVVFEGRGEGHVQAAQPGGNTTWYSVTLMSGPGEQPTVAQVDAVRQLRAWLMRKGLGAAVKGHRDFFSTSCPGDVLYRMVRDGTFTKSAGRGGTATPKPPVHDDNPVPEFERTLRLASPMMRGDDVRTWQDGVRRFMPRLLVDGWFGADSKRACEAMQRTVGMPVTGVVDEEAWLLTWVWEPEPKKEKSS